MIGFLNAQVKTSPATNAIRQRRASMSVEYILTGSSFDTKSHVKQAKDMRMVVVFLFNQSRKVNSSIKGGIKRANQNGTVLGMSLSVDSGLAFVKR